MQNRSIELSWPLALCLLLPLWIVGMFMRDYWTPDEPREADIVWRMAQQNDRAIPHLADEPFLEKPPLSYWLGAAAQQTLGGGAAATRVPNFIYVLLACMATGLLAQYMAGRRVAFIATLIFGSMFEVYRVAIWLAPDASLLAGCALALLGVYRGYCANNNKDKLLWYSVMHAGAALGFMAKSAPGWIVPALALLILIVWERRWRELWHWTLWAGALLQVLVIGAWILSVLAHPDGVDDLRVLFWNNLAGRFTDIHATGALNYAAGHQNWFGKYLVESFYYLFPWSLPVLAALWMTWRRARGEAGRPWRFAVSASVPFVLLLSVASTARDVYFVPACVGLSLLVSLWFEVLTTTGWSAGRLHQWLMRGALWMVRGLVVLVLLLLAAVASESQGDRLTCIVGMLGLIALWWLQWRKMTTRSPQDLLLSSFVQYASALLIAALCLSPLVDRVQDLPAIAKAIRQDNAGSALAIARPDETTIAMLDYEVGKPVMLLDGSDEELADKVRAWLATDVTRRVIVKLPGNGAGPLARLIKPSSRDHDDGLAAQLQRAGAATVLQRYALPHGRRYAVMGAAKEH
jgi:4-amino-4-deoxy-L-arabinose transferase-like glycosyltransferase